MDKNVVLTVYFKDAAKDKELIPRLTKVWIPFRNHFLYRLLQLLISVQFQHNLIVAYQKVIEESVQSEDSSRDFQHPP